MSEQILEQYGNVTIYTESTILPQFIMSKAL